jgi:hypothetical protein
MLDQLNKYKLNNHFFFNPTDALKEVCNAPTDKNGVYIVYELKNGKINLVYIGSSGKKNLDGTIKTRKVGLGGIKDRIVNGHQFGKISRKKSWPVKMLMENIEALDIYWWITYDNKFKDCPLEIESILLHNYLEIYGELPKWNNKIPRLKQPFS